MSTERFLAIVNPAAGSGRCGRRAATYLERLRGAGVELEVRETRRPGDGTEIARDGWGQGVRHFIAVGGDGTAFEVLNGLLPLSDPDDRPTLGLIPLGTGNSFLRDFSAEGAEFGLQAILEDRRRPCDALSLTHTEGRVFALGIVSFGFPAQVASLVNRRLKALGEAGYALAVILRLAALRPLHLAYAEDAGETLPAQLTFLCLCNNRFVGGRMLMAPEADIGDGLVDVIRAEALGRLELLRAFPGLFRGTHVEHRAVTVSRSRSLDFETSAALDLMIDGEVLHLEPRRLEIVPGALQVYA